MDSTLTMSLIVAVVAIVPGIWALINQVKKDKLQTKIDMDAATQHTALDIINPLQTEVSRLRIRTQELERKSTTNYIKVSQLQEADEVNGEDLMMISDMKEHSSKRISIENIAEKLWKKMYEKPVIVRCKYCGVHNVITSLECIKCGAPTGGKNA